METERIIFPTFSGILEPNLESKSFPDGESYVRIPHIESLAGKRALLFHRMYPNQDTAIFQLLLALEEITKKTEHTTAFVPYLPYARQDKIVVEGEVKSAHVLCKMLRHAGLERLVTLDCHFLKKTGEFECEGLRITNLTGADHMVKYFQSKYGELEVISPDKGAKYLVEGHGGASMTKVRGDYVTSEKKIYRPVETLKLDIDIKGKNVLVLDDMIAGGGTMVKAVELCRAEGAKNVFCGATHGLLLADAGMRLQEAGAKEVATTNSIPTEYSKISVMEIFEGVFQNRLATE
ncbi:MAG: ribose-phosphate diphosphokinase [Candidatus Micrarchaeia archaeon]